MPTPLQQLENNEAVLLMYAADELPPEDRDEVEQMLASDGGMRAELASIRDSLASVDGALGELDAITRLPMSSAVAIRRLGPALTEWQHQRLAPPPAAPAPAPLRYAWWIYPLASAAAILLAVTVWWGVRGEDVNVGGGYVDSNNPAGPQTPDILADRDPRGRGPGDAGMFFRGGPGTMMQIEPSDPELNDVEQQVASLSKPGGDQASASSIFMIDTPADDTAN